MLTRLLILNHTPQHGCSLERYHPKLWTSTRRIYAKLVVWNNLRDQIFHRNKIDARGSIRKAPGVITWALSLDKLRQVGETDAGAIIKEWNNRASRQQQLAGGKAQALKNVLDLIEVFTEKTRWAGRKAHGAMMHFPTSASILEPHRWVVQAPQLLGERA